MLKFLLPLIIEISIRYDNGEVPRCCPLKCPNPSFASIYINGIPSTPPLTPPPTLKIGEPPTTHNCTFE